jgi:hypothetical protein
MYYALLAFGVPLILVILTYKNKLSGLPSYYIKGTTRGALMESKIVNDNKRDPQNQLVCGFLFHFTFHFTLPQIKLREKGKFHKIDFLSSKRKKKRKVLLCRILFCCHLREFVFECL